MKIVMDATSIRSRPSGIGIYIKNLIEGLLTLSLNDRQMGLNFKLLYRNREFYNHLQKHYPDVIKEKFLDLFYYPFPAERTLQLLHKFDFLANLSESILGKPHIFHGLDYLNYPFANSQNIITIYDLSFIKYPHYSPDRILKTYQSRLEKCFQWTDLIITISENSKKDIMSFFHIPAEKIWVTPLASHYTTIDRRNVPPQSPTPYPYLLFVGTIEPRKNINTLIQAFEYLKITYNIPHHLVLIGQKGWKYESILDRIENAKYRNNIHQLDYLNDNQVAAFYQYATAFIYPSYYEGFGLPVLEAMGFGIPVITSDRSSLPEVTGDAALLINPDDFKQLAEAMLGVIENPQLRQSLIQKGKERSSFFSWKKTALITLQAYQSLL
ncbi:MAG: glycosyltransferase family 4 protein [Prochlorotrichaceae cyanobacterium]